MHQLHFHALYNNSFCSVKGFCQAFTSEFNIFNNQLLRNSGFYKLSSFSVIADISKFLPLISLPSSSPSPSVCHPPPTRPPARLLLQTQLRGRLNPAEIPHRCECDPWRPHLVHLPISLSLSLILLLLFPSPPLQHHCSTRHLSSSAPLEKLPLFFFFFSLNPLSLASVEQDFHSFCFPLQHSWPGFSSQRQTCCPKTD